MNKKLLSAEGELLSFSAAQLLSWVSFDSGVACNLQSN